MPKRAARRWIRRICEAMRLIDLKDPLLESIYAAANELKITRQHDPGASTRDAISTYIKRIPYETRVQGSEPIYSILNYIPNEESTKLLTSLKGKGPYIVNPEHLDHLLRQVVVACRRIIVDVKPDVIVYPSSSSGLLKKFVGMLHETYPTIAVGGEAFVKKILKAGDEEALINTKHPDWEKFAREHPKSVVELKRSLKNHLSDGVLELKKLYKPYLKFIKNFIELKNAAQTLDQVIDQNVLVVDDVLSSGATMLEMFRQLREFEPKSLSGLTIFKRTSDLH